MKSRTSWRRTLAALLFAALSLSTEAALPLQVPVLRITAPNGSRSVLIGTMHVPVDGLPQPSGSVMDGAKQYVIESSTTSGPQPSPQNMLGMLNPAAQAAVLASMGHLDTSAPLQFPDLPMAPWASGLTAAQLSVFRDRVRCNLENTQVNIPVSTETVAQMFLAYNSPEAAASVAERPCAKPGLLSRDDLMARAAAAHGLKATVLESQVAVDTQRKAVADHFYRDIVYQALSEAGRNSVEATADAIAHGDYDRVIEIGAQGFDPREAAVFQHAMVTDRNVAWMRNLPGILNKGGAVLVVGAGHLGGPGGIVALLRKEGYKVEPSTVPALVESR